MLSKKTHLIVFSETGSDVFPEEVDAEEEPADVDSNRSCRSTTSVLFAHTCMIPSLVLTAVFKLTYIMMGVYLCDVNIDRQSDAQ